MCILHKIQQNKRTETQDKVFLDILIEKLIAADWSNIVVGKSVEEPYVIKGITNIGRGWESDPLDLDADYNSEPDTYGEEALPDEKGVTVNFMVDIIKENPHAIALVQKDLGYDAYDLYKIITQKSNPVVGSGKK